MIDKMLMLKRNSRAFISALEKHSWYISNGTARPANERGRKWHVCGVKGNESQAAL
jgi:hypothetical protein